ncbi:MAG: class I SAM-dependent methyltransferase [Bacteroidetes bacterium]|nr:class I SAM-dependent methyltransferase [Bacteroidota bacterium]
MKEVLYDKYVSSGHSVCQGSKVVQSPYFEFLYRIFFRKRAKDDQILDIGCGSGDFLLYLKSKGFSNIFGVDISSEQIDLARNMNGLSSVIEEDLLKYVQNTAAGSFNAIFAKDILEHLTLEELFDLGGELKRILKQDGIIIGHVPNANGIFGMKVRYGDLTHEQAFNEKSLNQLFRTIGFKKIFVLEDVPRSNSFLKTLLRVIVWKVCTFFIRVLHYIETGEKHIALSSNITFFVYK